MTTVSFSKLDGSNTPRQFQTSQLGSGNELDNDVIADGLTGLAAQVANHTAHNQNLPSTVYSLLVGAVGKLMNATGVNFDAWRAAGSDAGSAAGIAAVGAMLEREVRVTATSTVAASSPTSTLLVGSTTGFVVGAPIVLEPDSATNAETALITAVVLNTSIAVQFPPGGALYTHTANYTVLSGVMNAARQAPGGTGVTLVSSDGTKPTYRAGAVAQTLYSTAAAVLLEIRGSTTKTVRIKKITLWAQAGTKFYAELTLLRCTGLSAGTPVVAVIGKQDNDPAATMVINYYTAAATAGAGSVVTGAQPLSTVVPSATATMQKTVWDFADNETKSFVLRGAADVVQVFNNTTVLGTATYGWEVLAEEDNS